MLFDGVFRDQFVNGYGVFLADAVRTVGCLVLGCHVPPRIVVDDDVSSSQVQAGSAGF